MSYSTADLCKLTGLTRQRIASLRKPGGRLQEGRDWNWERGTIVYTESAIEALKGRAPGRPKVKSETKGPR